MVIFNGLFIYLIPNYTRSETRDIFCCILLAIFLISIFFVLNYEEVNYFFEPCIFKIKIKEYKQFYHKIINELLNNNYENFKNYNFKNSEITFCRKISKQYNKTYFGKSLYICCVCYCENISSDDFEDIIKIFRKYSSSSKNKAQTHYFNLIICSNTRNDILIEKLQHYFLYGHRSDAIVTAVLFDEGKIILPNVYTYTPEYKKYLKI